MPRQCRGQVCAGDVVRLLRRALTEVCAELEQQRVVRAEGGATVTAEQLDLSGRGLQAQLHNLGHPRLDLMRCITRLIVPGRCDISSCVTPTPTYCQSGCDGGQRRVRCRAR